MIESLKKSTQQYQKYANYEAKRWQAINRAKINSWADIWEIAAQKWSDSTVIVEVNSGKTWTYQALDRAADRIAFWAISTQQKYIGVCLNNSGTFLAVVLGLAKAGIVAVLFNWREPRAKLSQLAKIYGINIVLGEPIPALKSYDPVTIIAESWPGRIDQKYRSSVILEDPMAIIFTSGTSGRTKPALFSHRRMIGAGIAWSIRTEMLPRSNCYITLPLYHGNGLAVAFASCVEVGATAVIRERFSVSSFLADVRQYNCDSVVYIGELWRYLANSPIKPSDRDNPIRVIFGNGLTSPLWETMLERFDIERVVEHYGATEMPASALTNWTGRPGYCGFIPPDSEDAADIILVDRDGQPVAFDEPGQALLKVPNKIYKGYLDPTLDEAKLWRNFREPGDLWWKSGDLLSRDRDGFFKFVDRLGDTFRWKGENVACVEVEEAILATGLVKEAVVYGVSIPGASGKAGMASISPKSPLENLDILLSKLQTKLPSYAVPLIIRLVSDSHETTATLKITKNKIAAEGFDRIDLYPHFVLIKGKYVLLTKEGLLNLKSGFLVLG